MWIVSYRLAPQEINFKAFVVDGSLELHFFSLECLISALQDFEHGISLARYRRHELDALARIPKQINVHRCQRTLLNSNTCCGFVRVESVRSHNRKMLVQPRIGQCPKYSDNR